MSTATDLHKFREDLKKTPPLGVLAPPRIVRAADLDDNFKKVTLIKGEGEPPLYDVRYTKDGTRITRILPKGTRRGDMLYFDGRNWRVLAAPSGTSLRVLSIQNGNLAWTATQDC